MAQPSPATQQPQARPFAAALAALHRHPWWTRAGILAYAASVTFPHAGVQWVANEIAIRIGHANLYRLAAAIALLLTAILTGLVCRAALRQPRNSGILGLWLLTLALIGCTWGAFTANNLELVHYPQYFPEGILFLALTFSPAEALCWVVLFGALDEGFQYWALPRTRVSLFDFNDIYMDLLGGAAGAVFAMAFTHCLVRWNPRNWRADWKRPGAVILLAIIGLGSLLWVSGLMLIVREPGNSHYWFALGDFRAPSFWAHVVENGPKHYHTLTPLEGVCLILLTVALFGALSGKIKPPARPTPR